VNPDHLFLGTQAENMADCKAKGRQAKGASIKRAKLTPAQVLFIRSFPIKRRGTAQQLADVFGVQKNTIWKVQGRRLWGHLG
jgi:hypothetical protein